MSKPLPPGTLAKVKANTVPYGPETCRVGDSVWIARNAAGELIVLAPTKAEAERKYRSWLWAEEARLWMERKARLAP